MPTATWAFAGTAANGRTTSTANAANAINLNFFMKSSLCRPIPDLPNR
jgi:hypothetical protein